MFIKNIWPKKVEAIDPESYVESLRKACFPSKEGIFELRSGSSLLLVQVCHKCGSLVNTYHEEAHLILHIRLGA